MDAGTTWNTQPSLTIQYINYYVHYTFHSNKKGHIYTWKRNWVIGILENSQDSCQVNGKARTRFRCAFMNAIMFPFFPAQGRPLSFNLILAQALSSASHEIKWPILNVFHYKLARREKEGEKSLVHCTLLPVKPAKITCPPLDIHDYFFGGGGFTLVPTSSNRTFDIEFASEYHIDLCDGMSFKHVKNAFLVLSGKGMWGSDVNWNPGGE